MGSSRISSAFDHRRRPSARPQPRPAVTVSVHAHESIDPPAAESTPRSVRSRLVPRPGSITLDGAHVRLSPASNTSSRRRRVPSVPAQPNMLLRSWISSGAAMYYSRQSSLAAPKYPSTTRGERIHPDELDERPTFSAPLSTVSWSRLCSAPHGRDYAEFGPMRSSPERFTLNWRWGKGLREVDRLPGLRIVQMLCPA